MPLPIPIIGPILDVINTTIDKIFPDKTEAERIKGSIQTAVLNIDLAVITESAKVILAEATGGWLQRNWRPLTMLCVTGIIFNNYLLFPYMKLMGLPAVLLDLPDRLWDLMTLGMGGYVIGRSAEKIATAVSGKGLLERILKKDK